MFVELTYDIDYVDFHPCQTKVFRLDEIVSMSIVIHGLAMIEMKGGLCLYVSESDYDSLISRLKEAKLCF